MYGLVHHMCMHLVFAELKKPPTIVPINNKISNVFIKTAFHKSNSMLIINTYSSVQYQNILFTFTFHHSDSSSRERNNKPKTLYQQSEDALFSCEGSKELTSHHPFSPMNFLETLMGNQRLLYSKTRKNEPT